jgi:hypothetical protein
MSSFWPTRRTAANHTPLNLVQGGTINAGLCPRAILIAERARRRSACDGRRALRVHQYSRLVRVTRYRHIEPTIFGRRPWTSTLAEEGTALSMLVWEATTASSSAGRRFASCRRQLALDFPVSSYGRENSLSSTIVRPWSATLAWLRSWSRNMSSSSHPPWMKHGAPRRARATAEDCRDRP